MASPSSTTDVRSSLYSMSAHTQLTLSQAQLIIDTFRPPEQQAESSSKRFIVTEVQELKGGLSNSNYRLTVRDTTLNNVETKLLLKICEEKNAQEVSEQVKALVQMATASSSSQSAFSASSANNNFEFLSRVPFGMFDIRTQFQRQVGQYLEKKDDTSAASTSAAASASSATSTTSYLTHPFISFLTSHLPLLEQCELSSKHADMHESIIHSDLFLENMMFTNEARDAPNNTNNNDSNNICPIAYPYRCHIPASTSPPLTSPAHLTPAIGTDYYFLCPSITQRPIVIYQYLDGVMVRDATGGVMKEVAKGQAALHNIEVYGSGSSSVTSTSSTVTVTPSSTTAISSPPYLLGFIDFEEMGRGPRLLDVCMTIVGCCYNVETNVLNEKLAQEFLEEYAKRVRKPLTQLEADSFHSYMIWSLLAIAYWRWQNFNIVQVVPNARQDAYRAMQVRVEMMEEKEMKERMEVISSRMIGSRDNVR